MNRNFSEQFSAMTNVQSLYHIARRNRFRPEKPAAGSSVRQG